MPRNIVIYSDGTGQAGGFRFDESRSNIYKLYRATRCGPDSSIDPNDQVAFYDPGLGSQADGATVFGRIFRWVHNTVAQATGFGITRNLIDCYAALIQLWRPGDRIFLVGFSRGAYTIRCLAGIVARCGIPTHQADAPGKKLKIDDGSVGKLASYAVKHVYQFTYPRKQSEATGRQKFLLETRQKIAARFRTAYGAVDRADTAKANVYPHFIGVFDTVAALGNRVTGTMFAAAFFAVAAALGIVGEFLAQFSYVPWIGRLLSYLTFGNVFIAVVAAAAAVALFVYVFTHLKWDFAVGGYDWTQLLRTIHFNDLWMKFYDQDLDPNVKYARHAISINENRANFKRVGWWSERIAQRDEHNYQWFEQVWFSGNHSDIGGSYPENESRLSDIALEWMLRWAVAVPGGLKFNPDVLRLWGHHDGQQHDEVAAGYSFVPKWTGLTWPKEDRSLPGKEAIMHPSVYHRFDLEDVAHYDEFRPYRPSTLETHVDFADFYAVGGAFPATSYASCRFSAEMPPPFSMKRDAGA